MSQQWKESIIVPIYKNGDKTDCSNYRGISLLPTTYKILSNILISKLTQYADESNGKHQCGLTAKYGSLDVETFHKIGSVNFWHTCAP